MAEKKLRVNVRRGGVSGLGSIFTALLAVSCCIGPAVFIIFGTSIGILSRLTVFSAFRPYFLAAAFILLGYSFWKLYLKKEDCDCIADKRAQILSRVIFWAGLVLTVFALAFYKIVELFFK